MADNILNKVSLFVSSLLDDDEICKLITASLEDIDTIYSYLIYAKYKNKKLTGWLIEYNFSQKDKYNTLNCKDIITEIIIMLLSDKHNNSGKYIIGYKQPCIELMLELYKPLINKLACEQCEHWNSLEYEDAISMCQFTMVKLHKKGYYIHKNLLKTSFRNDVLMELRAEKNKPEIISLEKIIFSESDSEPISLADTIQDTELELEKELAEEKEALLSIFNEIKDLLIELYGERQFEQLFRDYGNKHTTTWSRKKMQQIKDKIKKLGISWESFSKYYN